MSPRTGRPPKPDAKKKRIEIRLSEEKARQLQDCADKMGVTKTEVIENGIDLVEAKLKK